MLFIYSAAYTLTFNFYIKNKYAVPKTCLTVPVKVFDYDFFSVSITVAIFLIYSNVRSPVCLTLNKL